jgi:AcrR family transcriptional regulator
MSTTTAPTPRQRIVFSAAQLIRRHGVHATGMRDVVEHAAAPRGSLQYYFPEGKQQLVNEALAWAGRYASGRVTRFRSTGRVTSPSRLFAAMTQQWVDEFTTTGFHAGCPLAAATVDCADGSASTREAIVAAFAEWRTSIQKGLTELGVKPRKAPAAATLMLSALEGAILLARSQQSVQPLRTVVRELGPVLDALASNQ